MIATHVEPPRNPDSTDSFSRIRLGVDDVVYRAHFTEAPDLAGLATSARALSSQAVNSQSPRERW